MPPSEGPYLRIPAVHGDRLAFVADDDLWLGSVDGGPAARLTAARSWVRAPAFSPDGSLLAWTSKAAGEPEAFVADLAGGSPRRLTFWGDPTTKTLGWTPDGRVVVASATGQAFASETWAWAVAPDGGGPPERLPYGPVSAVSFAAAGGVVVGTDQSASRGASWKRYRGGTGGKLWVDADGSGTFARVGAELGGQIEDPQWWGERIVFVSDHEGWGNVYSVRPDGSDLRRHSDHGDAYARAARGDGRRLVYQCAGDLWVLDDLAADAAPRRVDVSLGSARHGNAPWPVEAAKALNHVAADRAGRGTAVGVRGAVAWLTFRDGPARVVAPGGAVRARQPDLLGDDRLVWVTDASGDDRLETAPVDGGPAEVLAAGGLGRVVDLAGSPDGEWVATASHDGRVRLTAAASGDTVELDRSGHDIASGLTWSPDSAWLAWSHGGPVSPAEDGLRQIRMASVASREVTEVTPMRFADHSPAFSADGRHLAFLSARTFDPVYEEVRFELDFAAATRPYIVRLGAGDAAPLQPTLDGRPVGAAPDPDPPLPDAPPVTHVDADGIQHRVHVLPVAAGRYTDLVATAAGVAWRSHAIAGELGDAKPRPDADPLGVAVQHLDLRTGRLETLLDASESLAVTAGGKQLVVRTKDGLVVVPSDHRVGDGDADRVTVDLTRVRVTVDPPAEWPQMFDEAGRLMALRYWVADMAGYDWEAALARYRPLASRVCSRDELSEVLWELQGELATSHAYVMEPDLAVPPRSKMGHLGADLRPGYGGWVVEQVVPSDPSVPAATSPLAAAGIVAGDVVVAVDGQAVGADGPGPLLVGAAGKTLEITLQPAGGGDQRRVAVVALADERRLRYLDRVARRRAEVHERTGGRVGYLHLPDMQIGGWAEMHRDMRMETRCAALIVDLRNNRGGHTSALVFERLSSKVRAYQVIRDFEGHTYPNDVPRGPMVALVDQNAGSDGDIGSFSFRHLGLGPLVGTRTWGGTIGIDGRYGLVDGGMVTQPAYAYYFDGIGWGVENHGIDPDVEVPIPPHDWAAGRDPQMDKAIELVLAGLDAAPAPVVPDPASRPDRRPPDLPPRP